MFDIGYSELLVVAIVALVVIGPKDLPRVMRTVGQWVGRARGMARHFRSGIDTMIREAELEEMEQKWRAENERIMREHPAAASWDDPVALPPPAAGDAEADAGEIIPATVPAPDPGNVMLPIEPPAAAEPASSAPAAPPPADDGQLSLLPPDPAPPRGASEGEGGAVRRPLP
ncbi:twin-arginine translocase subunit TatB [Sphingomonas parva]|uniref:Sec-independent protein translocase protein TatB n=1 Tax=Sphingomonas parva TaxID=2555898 RepID=A0A4Y8ZUB3_9SPHN|nr:Sec-independent protein translocase protein TatB [Sphingomonas parva]TFI58046.1 twin-arginine translocase subunit TatB [Sphingomonas parva]